jgi:hypothetical protein
MRLFYERPFPLAKHREINLRLWSFAVADIAVDLGARQSSRRSAKCPQILLASLLPVAFPKIQRALAWQKSIH